jgi:hypothetical protein
LKDVELEHSLLELRLERVEEIRVRRDKPTSMAVLIVRVLSDAETGKEGPRPAVQVSLEPNIWIRIND